MARIRRPWTIWKGIAGALLAVVAYAGLQYGAMLNELDRAAALYSQGDVESALRTYEAIEGRIQAHGAIRFIPARDRLNLLLNEARLLYALRRYDDALERLGREEQISGVLSDARAFLLRGNIAFRRAMQQHQQSIPKVRTGFAPTSDDVALLEQNLIASEDNFRESLRLDPDSPDAKHNFELVSEMRKALANSDEEKLRILGETPDIRELPPESAG
jgi:tetratricopeptide (TPR) repeat protein